MTGIPWGTPPLDLPGRSATGPRWRAVSGFSDVDHSADSSTYIRRLDRMRASPFWQRVKQQTFASLDLRPGDRVVDIGCGTGDDIRALCQIVGPAGLAVGVDRSVAMVSEALARGANSDLPMSYLVGDAEQLGLGDGAFDACRVERVLQHLADPTAAVAEIVRVLRPSGRIVVVEPDYGTLRIDGAQADVTARILARRERHFRAPRIGRQLASVMRAHGLIEMSVSLLRGYEATLDEDAEERLLENYARPARDAGVTSPSETAQWLSDLRRAARIGTYRHEVMLFLVRGRKPPAQRVTAERPSE